MIIIIIILISTYFISIGIIPSIPVQPLSYADAEPILRNIQGGVQLPSNWQVSIPYLSPLEDRYHVSFSSTRISHDLIYVFTQF